MITRIKIAIPNGEDAREATVETRERVTGNAPSEVGAGTDEVVVGVEVDTVIKGEENGAEREIEGGAGAVITVSKGEATPEEGVEKLDRLGQVVTMYVCYMMFVDTLTNVLGNHSDRTANGLNKKHENEKELEVFVFPCDDHLLKHLNGKYWS